MAVHSFDKMAAVFVIINVMRVVESHVETSSSSDSSDSRERVDAILADAAAHPSNYRRQQKDYDGLAIEIPGNVNNEIIEHTTPRPPTATPLIKKPSLPLSRRYRRIYNPDEVASIEDYPFMAALLVNNELWCGGVIIDVDKVLTAAHCLQLQYNNRFFREYVKMLTVRVGSTNATSGGELLRVSEIFFHPNYKPATLEFNFAVVRLHRNLSFGNKEIFVDSIPYSSDKVIPVDRDILFLGWGSVLSISGTGGQVLLQQVKLPVYDVADCQEIYGRDLVTRTNFCAGYITQMKNVCNHDAGGPAIMDNVLYGILSFSSKRCDQPDQPAVFSTVGAIAPWLEDLGERKTLIRNAAMRT